ncbi:MAG: dihydropteroate synthase [Deltaproteobacteria bacterium]|nr:dihydropteroate synthase [Deltaproteobacteria bacterium]MCL5277095.1 dihydropteroate synthase [Deltaproteobacteria bacterium]
MEGQKSVEMKRVYLLNPLSVKEISACFRSLSVHPEGIGIMSKKSAFYTFRVRSLSSPAANILKQEALAAGAELATAWRVIKAADAETDALLTGTYRQVEIIVQKIRSQQFGLPCIAAELESAIRNLFIPRPYLEYRGSRLDLATGPKIMGIVNVTPDSFSDGGRFFSTDAAVGHGMELCEQGADVLDIGGESTRPGSRPVDAAEEKRRVVPVIERLRQRTNTPISIDTRKSEVAKAALDSGADIVNDISALTYDSRMTGVVRRYGAGVVMMHMKGTPKTMQKAPAYDDVIADILSFLEQRTDDALQKGIDRGHIVVDPGIGFGKTPEHNLSILKHMKAFRALGFPLLVGVSRKSFIGKLTGAGVEGRSYGSVAAAVWAAANGADIVRVHDVKETRQALLTVRHIMDARCTY